MAVADEVRVRKLLKEIKAKTKAILESNTNANHIVDVLEVADAKDKEILTAFIKAIHKIFSRFLSQRTWFKTSPEAVKKDGEQEQENAEKTVEDPQKVFRNWLHEKYLLAIKKLLELLHHDSQNVKELSLCALMKFVVGEAEAMKKSSYYFPNTLFRKLCDALLDANYDMTTVIERFGDYFEYSDVVYYLLKNTGRMLLEGVPTSGKYQGENVFAMLSQIKMKQTDQELDKFLVNPDTANKLKGSSGESRTFQHDVMLLKSHRKVFSSAWLQFLRLPLKPAIHKKVLISLHSDIMPHLVDPKLLMDFLTDSYNLGGANSLLALNGLFILIHQHNLDYPQFYNKLYALFEPSIFHVKYRSRFFSLADLFLSSTHLPSYLVAAFVKRLSRIALVAPPSGAMVAIPFVCNLIKRHPSCQVLIHRKQAIKLFMNEDEKEVSPDFSQGDPYDPDEPDPAKAKALDSCLWELKTLQVHFYPDVSSLVEMLEKPLGKQETDVSAYFDVGYESLFEKECIRFTSQNAVMEYQPPKSILGKEFCDIWAVM